MHRDTTPRARDFWLNRRMKETNGKKHGQLKHSKLPFLMLQFRKRLKFARLARERLSYRNPKVSRPLIAIYPSSIRFLAWNVTSSMVPANIMVLVVRFFGTDRLVRFFRFAIPFLSESSSSTQRLFG